MKEKVIRRKVRKLKAKDYQRDAKYYDYFYIIFEGDYFGLKLNGWNHSVYEIKMDENGKYINIPIFDTIKKEYDYKCYLIF